MKVHHLNCGTMHPPGARLVWDSRPGGRGRVLEKVVSRIAGDGVTSAVEDGQIRGTQGVTFSATDDDAVRVGVALEYELKEPPSWPLAGLFIKRAMAESLRRTLARFAIERSADAG